MLPTPVADIATDASLVAQLLAKQCPALAGLPVTQASSGWDNTLYRLGDSLAARLPRRKATVGLLTNEIAWLPELGDMLTVSVPQPVFVGSPSEAFPYPWSVIPWFEATPASELPVSERTAFAEQLADQLWTLHQPAPRNAPVNPFRGMSLAQPASDARIRERISAHPASAELLARWEAWSAAPDFDGVDVWLHGDPHPHNMLVGADGRLAALIDWGDMTAGDPACDLATAWLTFDAQGRRAFIERIDLGHPHDAATWTRAKAWALHLGLLLSQNSSDEPRLAAIGEHALSQLLTDKA